MDKKELTEYIRDAYGVSADFPWIKDSEAMVFRHIDNKKWFALIVSVPKCKLGLQGSEITDIVNLKCDPAMTGSLRMEQGFFPAYHMNKENWITVLLDNSVSGEKIKPILDMSYDLTATKFKKKK